MSQQAQNQIIDTPFSPLDASAYCSQHQYEGILIPKAVARGWPTEVDWDIFVTRVASLRNNLCAFVFSADEVQSNKFYCVLREKLEDTSSINLMSAMKQMFNLADTGAG